MASRQRPQLIRDGRTAARGSGHATGREPFRWAVVALSVGNAAVHGYLAPMHLDEAPYMGALFFVLAAASLALAAALTVADYAWLWVATATITAAALAGLLVSRTVGLPELHDEIGSWTDTLAVVTLVLEAAIVMFAATRIIWYHADRRHERAKNPGRTGS